MQIRLYMKSGNQIIIKHVEEVNAQSRENLVVSLEVKWKKDAPDTNVFIQSIDVSQIEAIESLED